MRVLVTGATVVAGEAPRMVNAVEEPGRTEVGAGA